MNTLIDLLFMGKLSTVNLLFLEKYFGGEYNIVLNSPQIKFNTYDELMKLFSVESYVDLVVNKAHLDINGKNIDNVFINLTIDEGKLELLYFFDFKDLGTASVQDAMHLLRSWSLNHKRTYKFEQILCQSDNGSVDEYFFNDEGYGPLMSVNHRLS